MKIALIGAAGFAGSVVFVEQSAFKQTGGISVTRRTVDIADALECLKRERARCKAAH